MIQDSECIKQHFDLNLIEDIECLKQYHGLEDLENLWAIYSSVFEIKSVIENLL
jgi:hypothetical protein